MARATTAGKNDKKKLTKPTKPTRAEKKAVRVARRKSRRETFTQMRQAFTMTRKNDAKLVPYLVLAFVVVAAVVYVALLCAFSSVWLPILPAILLGVLAALFLFSRRAQSSAYSQAEGQPGAAAYVLGQLRG